MLKIAACPCISVKEEYKYYKVKTNCIKYFILRKQKQKHYQGYMFVLFRFIFPTFLTSPTTAVVLFLFCCPIQNQELNLLNQLAHDLWDRANQVNMTINHL